MTDAQIKNELDKAARIFNKVHAAIRERFPTGFIYVESEGQFHAMSCEPIGGNGSDPKNIITSSITAKFDCGAW